MLELLKNSCNFDLYKAVKLCEKNNLISELVYLYEIMEDHVNAIKLVTSKLDNIDLVLLNKYNFKLKAINICKRVENEYLWEILLNYCIDSPEKIKILIEKIGYSLNVVKILNVILYFTYILFL